jgi:hypothetical protein
MPLLGIPADAVSAYAAIAAFVLAAIALLREIRHTTWVRQTDLMLKYTEMFNSPRTRHDRLVACKFLAEKRPFDPEDNDLDKIGPVLDFFQELAQRTRYGGLPLAFVHGDYFYWLAHYWAACKPYIDHHRRKGPMYLMDVLWLHERSRRIDLKKNEGAYSNVDHVQIDDFLQYEISTLAE